MNDTQFKIVLAAAVFHYKKTFCLEEVGILHSARAMGCCGAGAGFAKKLVGGQTLLFAFR